MIRLLATLILIIISAASPSEGKLLVSTSAKFLLSDEAHDRVTVRGIRGNLAITINFPGTVYVSDIRRTKNEVSFIANRMAGGDATITLSDDSGEYTLLSVPLAGCSWPTPQSLVIDPLPRQDRLRLIALNVPVASPKQSSKRTSGERFSRRLIIEAVKWAGGDIGARYYRLHVFAEDGDDLFSGLTPLAVRDIPPAVAKRNGIDTDKYDYFSSTVNGLRPNTAYDVQFFRHGWQCPPPISGGFIVF